MLLKLDVLASTTIKRKKPWPRIAWLGKDVGDLFLLDAHRISQLHLPSGKTKKKIPALQSFLEDAQGFGISRSGVFVAGALNSGKVFIWNKGAGSVKLTAVLDKIRNVQGPKNASLQLYISDCGKKVLILFGFHQVFLWETQPSSETVVTGDSLKGAWLQIQCGNYLLPDETDKETAVHGLFFVDPVCGTSATISWVFNKGDKIHVTTLRLLWSGTPYQLEDDASPVPTEEGPALPFTPTWCSFVHPLYNLIPAERVIKSRKAYVARVSPDGQVVAIAMNQKLAAHSRMMFYSLSRSAVAVVADLKGCGARVAHNQPSGRSWWIADMAWTRDSLLVVCITRRGCVAILTKLGEPLEISTVGCSVHMGPGLFLCLHPRIQFRPSSEVAGADSPESGLSGRDPLCQKFSVAVHPRLPLVLSSDGYLVTLMQLPSSATYAGVMTGFMRDVARLVPDAEVDIQAGDLSRVSSMSKISPLQAEASMSHGVSAEFLSDAPSENNSSGSSSVVPGYGLASGEHGVGAFGLDDTELESTSPHYAPGSADAILQAQSSSIVALSLGSSCGVNWSNEVGTAMDLTVSTVVKLFQFLLQCADHILQQMRGSSTLRSKSTADVSTRRGSSPVDLQLHKALMYFRMALEAFQWDVSHKNVFSRAFRLTHRIVREILLLKQLGGLYRVTTCCQVLKLAERVLNLVYSPSGSQNRSTQQQRGGSDIQEEREERDGDVASSPAFGNGREEAVLEEQQQHSVTQSHLGGTWLLLYNVTSDFCKKLFRRRRSSFSHQQSESRLGEERKMVDLLCEIQEKLQKLGVRIPSKAGGEGISSIISLPIEGLQDSMFLRRQSSPLLSPAQQQTPEALRRFSVTASRELSLSQLSISTPQKSPSLETLLDNPNGKERDTKTLLSILYLYLQQYDLQSAIDLVQSLIEPPVSPEHCAGNRKTWFPSSAQSSFISSNQEASGNVVLHAVLQNYPIVRVADKRGLEVVQSFGRFMAAYFSNLPLYVFPPYQATALPPLFLTQTGSNSSADLAEESDEPCRGVDRVWLERVLVSKAAREQGLDEVWSANSTLELMLLAGLVSEAAWLARNLGDWKNALLLSFAGDALSCRFPATSSDPSINLTFPSLPKDLNPQAIAMNRLDPTFKHESLVGLCDEVFHSRGDGAVHSSPADSKRPKQDGEELGKDGNRKLVQEVSRLLEAGVVAGCDLVPHLLTMLLDHLKEMASMFEWIVPEEFYLPYPPSYCPQPPNANKHALPSNVQNEEVLRAKVSIIVQKIFLLLDASNCLAPCVRWYAEQLVLATEGWYRMTRSDLEFPVPASLVGYVNTRFSFEKFKLAGGNASSPYKKGKGSPSKDATADGDQVRTDDNKPQLNRSVTSVLRVFRDLCALMWLLHVRDKMSKSSRKYRQLRSQTMGAEEESTAVHSVCWETLLWTTRLVPFGSFLGVSDKINDTLLTLLSDMPPSVATAEVTAQFFGVPGIIQTASGKAKFKRLMAHFRSVNIVEAGGLDIQDPNEPLSVYFRKKSLEWQEEVGERERLFGKACDQLFESASLDGYEGLLEDGDKETTGRSVEVGTTLFETDTSYLQFLDTFIMITVSRTAFSHHSKGSPPVPLLCPYMKHLLHADTKFLTALQTKAHSKTPSNLSKGTSSLFRSHSLADVRPRPESLPKSASSRTETGGVDIKKSNSANDVSRMGIMPGIQNLGSSMLNLLPVLSWLSRWSVEGSSLPSSNFTSARLSAADTQPAMRVRVSLPLLVNGLWLLQNVYWPWVSNKEVVVDIKVVKSIDPLKELDTEEPSGSLTGAPSKNVHLRKVLSDSNLQRIATTSAEQNLDGHWAEDNDEENYQEQDDAAKYRKGLRKSRSAINIGGFDRVGLENPTSIRTQQHEKGPKRAVRKDLNLTQDNDEENGQELEDAAKYRKGLRKSRSAINIGGFDRVGLESPTSIRTLQNENRPKRAVRKDIKFTQHLDRFSKSYSDHDIPNIVVQSPTTDEDKDFSVAFKRRYSSTRKTAESDSQDVHAVTRTSYHSDTELNSSVKPSSNARMSIRRKIQKNKQMENRKTARKDEVEKQKADALEMDAVFTTLTQGQAVDDTFKESPSSPQIFAATTLNETDVGKHSIRDRRLRRGKRKKKSALGETSGDRMDNFDGEPEDNERLLSRSHSGTARRAYHHVTMVMDEPKGRYKKKIPREIPSSRERYEQRYPRERYGSEDTNEPESSRERLETRESYEQKHPRETSHQSSAPLTNGSQVSQGQVELVLVVRPSGGTNASSAQSDIPVFRIPTAISNTQGAERPCNGEITDLVTGPVTRVETGSQTEHQALTTAAPSQNQYLQAESMSGLVNDHANTGPSTLMRSENVTRTVSSQTDQVLQQVPDIPRATLSMSLQQLPEAPRPLAHAPSDISKRPSSMDLDPRLFPAPHLPHLLHLPRNNPSTNLDLSKLRLVEVPRKREGLPLLRMPETEHASQSGMPDLSKIKFLDIPPKRAVCTPLELPQKLSPRSDVTAIHERGTALQWPLLRMTGNQAQFNGIDLSRMRLYEKPPTVRAAWPLLEAPKKAEPPKLIPLETILEFEKGLREQLMPSNERTQAREKENIRPSVEYNQGFSRPHETTVQERDNVGTPQPYVEFKDNRNAPSRQKRRQQAQEKHPRPRSTSPSFKSTKVRRRKSQQRKMIIVQPAKKTEKGNMVSYIDHEVPATRHARGKESSKKVLEKSVSLSESELELSKISDHVLEISDEEERYFRVEKSPEPIMLTKVNTGNQGNKTSTSGLEDTTSEPPKRHVYRSAAEKTAFPESADDFIPGPPSMQRMKETIGRKLNEVDRQMLDYRNRGRYGESSYNEKSKTSDRVNKPSGSQQNVGVQVGAHEEQFHTDLRARPGYQAISMKISSSVQTDQLESRPPERIELVTSAVQTEQDIPDSVSIKPHGPSLPPDIFMKLKMPTPSSAMDSVTHVSVDVDDASGGAPPGYTVVDEQADFGPPVSVRGRQFLSVADIGGDDWIAVQKTPQTTGDDTRKAVLEKGVPFEESMDAEAEIVSATENQSSHEDEAVKEIEEEAEPTVRGPGRVTLDLLDSTDSPVERFYPLPFPSTSNSAARAVSTNVLNERMKEMSERILAIDQITENMDREFKSSRVLLRAIESIDDVLTQSSTEAKASGGEPRRWGDNAPWRRRRKTSIEEELPRGPQGTQEVDDSVDLDLEVAQENVGNQKGDSKLDESDKDEKESTSEESIGEETDKDAEANENDSSDYGQEASLKSEGMRPSEPEVQKQDPVGAGRGATNQNEKAQTSISHDSGRNVLPLDSVAVPPQTLREILRDKDPQENRFSRRDRSPDARQDLKQWMLKKRSERLADWRNQQEDFRAQEYQPFMSPTQGSSSFKKMKFMEQERESKRRTKEDENKQRRMESASDLISEMLSEPIPKPKARQPNLRYARDNKTRVAKPLVGKKKSPNERHRKKPKGLPKGQRRSNQQDATNSSVFQQSNILPAKEKRYGKRSPVPEEFVNSDENATPGHLAPGFESQIRSSTPVFPAGDLPNRLPRSGCLVTNDATGEAGGGPTDDYWRSGSPTGAEFVTTATYRNFSRDRSKRLRARDESLRRAIETSRRETPRRARASRDGAEVNRRQQTSRPSVSPLLGGESSVDIDRLLEDIPDDGFTLDGARLEGIESLLDEDEELRDLLAGVIGVGVGNAHDQAKSSADHVPWDLRTRTSNQTTVLSRKPQRSNYTGRPSKSSTFKLADMRRKDDDHTSGRTKRRQNSSLDVGNVRSAEPVVPSASGLLLEFDDAVSPWNTGDSGLRMSDDVAQLLAEAKEAVGDNLSESSGSVMSNIDWDAVSRIMNEV